MSTTIEPVSKLRVITLAYPVGPAELAKQLDALRNHEASVDYALCKNAIRSCVQLRTAIENRRKELKKDSIQFGREVDKVAKELTAMIEDVEGPLAQSKERVDAARKAEKEAKANAEREAIAARVRAEVEAKEADKRRSAEEKRQAAERARVESEAREQAARAENEKLRAELEALKAALPKVPEHVVEANSAAVAGPAERELTRHRIALGEAKESERRAQRVLPEPADAAAALMAAVDDAVDDHYAGNPPNEDADRAMARQYARALSDLHDQFSVFLPRTDQGKRSLSDAEGHIEHAIEELQRYADGATE